MDQFRAFRVHQDDGKTDARIDTIGLDDLGPGDGKSDVPRARPQWDAALTAANSMLRARPKDPTHGALFFHSTAIKSPWLRSRERTTRIGGHVFYR